MGTLRRMLASRTWRLRGAAAAVLVVLAGGWTLGVAGLGGETATDRAVATTPSETASETPSDTPTPEELDPAELVESSETATEAASESPSADDGLQPVAETPDAEREDSPPPPRTRNPDPTPTRGTPTPTPRPSQSPTPTPSERADCAGLAQAVDCLLAPITSKP